MYDRDHVACSALHCRSLGLQPGDCLKPNALSPISLVLVHTYLCVLFNDVLLGNIHALFLYVLGRVAVPSSWPQVLHASMLTHHLSRAGVITVSRTGFSNMEAWI